MWTVPQNEGPTHLGLRCNAFSGHQMALITSGLRAVQAAGKNEVTLMGWGNVVLAGKPAADGSLTGATPPPPPELL